MFSSEISLNSDPISASILLSEESEKPFNSSLTPIHKATIASVAGFAIYKTTQSSTLSRLATALKENLSILDLKTISLTKNQALIGAVAFSILAIHQRENIKLCATKIRELGLKALKQTSQTILNTKTKAKKAFEKYKTLWKSDTAKMIAIHTLALAILAITAYSLKKKFDSDLKTTNSQTTTNNCIENTQNIDSIDTVNPTTESTPSKVRKAFDSTKKFFSNIKTKISEKSKNFYHKMVENMENRTDYPYSPEHKFAGLFQPETNSTTKEEEKDKSDKCDKR